MARRRTQGKAWRTTSTRQSAVRLGREPSAATTSCSSKPSRSSASATRTGPSRATKRICPTQESHRKAARRQDRIHARPRSGTVAARAYQRAQAVVQPGLGRKDAVPAARDSGGQVRPHGRLARVQDAKQGRIDRGLSGDLGGACARNGPDARTNKARVSVRSCGPRRSLAARRLGRLSYQLASASTRRSAWSSPSRLNAATNSSISAAAWDGCEARRGEGGEGEGDGENTLSEHREREKGQARGQESGRDRCRSGLRILRDLFRQAQHFLSFLLHFLSSFLSFFPSSSSSYLPSSSRSRPPPSPSSSSSSLLLPGTLSASATRRAPRSVAAILL